MSRIIDRKRRIASRRPRLRTPRRRRSRWTKPPLKVREVLQWADQFRREKGRWPHHFDGHIRWAGEETWARVNDALAKGNRGLPGGSSLARLLFIHRGVRSPRNVPDLSERQIFRWARSHFKRSGRWPRGDSGKIANAPGESWAAVDLALARGTRGLAGGSSLAQLFDAQGVKRNAQKRLPLTQKQILGLADVFYKTNGYWPYRDSGDINGLPDETWGTIDKALQRGSRGLPGGMTLASFLDRHRGIFEGRTRRLPRIPKDMRLKLDQIIAWAEVYRRRHGRYPNRESGPVAGASGLKWSTIDSALKTGSRGLPAGSSLAKQFWKQGGCSSLAPRIVSPLPWNS